MTYRLQVGKRAVFGLLLVSILASLGWAQQRVRIKDVASISGVEELQLFGYGLVVGLAGTGDKTQSVFTQQTVANMLKNMGIEMPDQHIRVRNVASVMVTGTLQPYKKKGTRFDVSVSSMGDATSLEGGTLILTTIQGPDGQIYGSAQGPLSTGGYNIDNIGLTSIRKNHVVVGLIPDGAIVQKAFALDALDGNELSLSLTNPDFTSALMLASAVNKEFETMTSIPIAKAVDAATINLDFNTLAKDSIKNKIELVEFISRMENLQFEVANTAKIVINERTGTIVAGGNATISEVAVSHGGIKVEIVNTPELVQPQPFSAGSTAMALKGQTHVEEKPADMVVLNGTTTASDLAQALNSLGVTPRDVITIFQAIKQAGALHGQLIIM